jgi:hypothetical protein
MRIHLSSGLLLAFMTCAFGLLVTPAAAEPLPVGCFAGILKSGEAAGTRVKMLVTRINARRFSVVESVGGRTFGSQCEGEETSITRYRVLLNSALGRFYGQQGDSCEFGLIRSTVSLRKQSSNAIAYGREERYFFGVAGGTYVSTFSSGTLKKSATACAGLQ